MKILKIVKTLYKIYLPLKFTKNCINTYPGLGSMFTRPTKITGEKRINESECGVRGGVDSGVVRGSLVEVKRNLK